MELIPILSTIILVATISTFILAIGAYILYKVREARGQQAAPAQAETIRAELITPAEVPQRQQEPRVIPQPIYAEAPQQFADRQPIFINQQGRPAPRSTASRFAQVRPRQFAGSEYVEMRGNARQQQQGGETQPSDTKFYKYTAEGYIPAKEDKNPGTLKWR